MRVRAWVLVLLAPAALFLSGSALAEDTQPTAAPDKDTWLGCWSHVYDAAHLAKHPGQLVAAMTLAVSSRTPQGDTDPGEYLAKVSAKLRDKPDVFSNLDGARCQLSGQAKDHLICSASGIFVGQFSLQAVGKTMKLALAGADQNLALVPGVDTSGFVLLSPQNPEHALFLLQPAPAGTCGQ